MQNYKPVTMNNPFKLAATLWLIVAVLLFGSYGARAAVQNVTLDPTATWNTYLVVRTNGVVYNGPADYPGYLGTVFAPGSSAIQFSIDSSGNFSNTPDLWCDYNIGTDPVIWSGGGIGPTANAGVACDSTAYIDSTSFTAGDSIVFSGELVKNTLAPAYSNSCVAFIKMFDAGWGWQGQTTVNLNTLTNGQTFVVTRAQVSTGGHTQYGIEWLGPPSRQATVASLGYALISTNISSTPPPPPGTNLNLYIDPSKTWIGYENYLNQGGLGGGYWYGAGRPAGVVQGSVNGQGIALCNADVWCDENAHTDTNYWADNTGTSLGVCTVDSTFYADYTGTSLGLSANSTVVFSGYFQLNNLDMPYSNSIVAFVKDYSSGWGLNSVTTVYLNTLTPGQQFSITNAVVAPSDHVQWGFEWQGPPARTNTSLPNYYGNLGFAVLSSNAVLNLPQVTGISPGNVQAVMGSPVSFTGTTLPSTVSGYQWQFNGANLTDGGIVSGSHSSVLSLSSVSPANEGTYSLVATAGGHNATNSVSLVVLNPSWLYFDRALAPYAGYINVWNGTNLISSVPPSGVAGTTPKASFGFAVNPTSLLRATNETATDTIILQPNTYVYDAATNAMDPAYINPNGSAAAYMEQDYILAADGLAGDTVTFSGFCTSNNLNGAYTATAWIKDGASDWSVEHRYDTNLLAGKPFIFSVATTPGDHVQYGFAIWGPDNSATNPITQGACKVKVYSPISSVNRSGANLNVGFPTVINHSYAVQYKTNLSDSSWNTLASTNGTGINVVVPDGASAAHRFYRLSTQ